MTADPQARRDDAALADRVEALAYADLYAAAPPALRSAFGLRVERLAGATALIAPGLPLPMFNRVIGLGFDEEASAAAVERLRALYRDAGVGHWWLHWNLFARPADGAERLAALGLALPARRSWAKLLRSTAAPPQPASALRVEPAAAAQVGDTTAAIVATFAMPSPLADWLAALHRRPGWRLYAITDGATVVGGACLFIAGDAGWLGMGAVAAAQRRRGGQQAALARRIADAAAAGCTRVASETGEPVGDEPNPSLANLRRCGFEPVASRLNFEHRGD